MQKTISRPVRFEGVGLHSGRPAVLRLLPAPAGHGLWFKRTDLAPAAALVPALWDAVEQVELCTRIVNAAGTTVSTIEHVMAAIAGCGIQNLMIEIDGPEVPILDGSAAPFVDEILSVGLRSQSAPIRALKIIDTVEVRNGPAHARLDPADGLEIDFSIDFSDAAIGRQEKRLSLANGTFVHELCDSRTFCRASDVEAMHARGLALGGTFDNAVVVDGARVLSPGGLRHRDEAVRHKMLDALGDLALAGAPILGRYTGIRAGHALTNALLRTLFARRDAFTIVEADETMLARLPGAGLRPEDAPALVA
ncbi:UDP-3-O-acyl-N-acetylglucosamine deacetylase [Palleronia abyssalis]|uniref:UDP-3-O-acyl-N-acetylglucosamine deacetylase n=1 Tax=Palleronia abyssalis TaxID=1501240 RepID=A0A2R8BW45_9RHOB|nr:UDP-3-O-acyl-N-acetylglucosamine deacetylase [Palleronia abyssalis]SPJ24378.1 UDP-3-O-acyl-N-acetylglucosamine deacetylase [Palleronia abyssalis]